MSYLAFYPSTILQLNEFCYVKALRIKAAEESRSISDIIHEAVSLLASEDAEDIADFDARIGEPNIGYAEFVQSLKADGII